MFKGDTGGYLTLEEKEPLNNEIFTVSKYIQNNLQYHMLGDKVISYFKKLSLFTNYKRRANYTHDKKVTNNKGRTQ